jgi:sialate O-acetylesterase
MKIRLFFTIFLLVLIAPCFAALKLPDIITDHMVLKQKSKVALWGAETAGQKVVVHTSWDREKYEAIADADGYWKVSVSTPKAGGPYEITFNGTNTIKVVDVLIGEVWISSGQSNMLFSMDKEAHAKEVIPRSKNTQIRLFRPARMIAQEEIKHFSAKTAKWDVCGPETVGIFSAMTYYFAAELQKKLGVPVGVINVSWGGVSIESWMPPSAIQSATVLQNPVARWKKWSADYAADSIKYKKEVAAYDKTKVGDKPKLPKSMYMMRRPHRQYSVLYNGMVSPYTSYALSGFLWYQGTSSVDWAEEYELQLNMLIKSWRSAFNYPDMPVIIGQLTAFTYEDEDKAYQLRQAQLNQRKLKNTYVFCTMDHGNLADVHPTNKLPYGQRFAAMALNKVYQQDNVPCMCPSFRKLKAAGDKLIISFNDAQGLYIKGGKLDELYLAGADGKFLKADFAEVRNNELIVGNASIKEPKQARYLYKTTANVQLYNQDQLPAFPFDASLK